MRVLHVHSGNIYGGVETMLLTIARARHLFSTMESNFAICFDAQLTSALREAGATPYILGDTRIRNLRSIVTARKRLIGILNQERFDAVIFHMPWAQILFGSIARSANIPSILWMHGSGGGYHPLSLLAHLTKPAHVICNSKYTAATVRRHYPRIECSVCYPPVFLDEPTDDSARAALRNELNTAADAVVVIQASRIEDWKGHRALLHALATLREIPHWIYWIAGGAQKPSEARYLGRLRRLASRLGISHRVRFLGNRRDILKLLSAADIYCQPNSRPEPFGIAFIEALRAGLPVVTTALGGALEIVDHSCGIPTPVKQPFSLARALRELVENKPKRAMLGVGGPPRADYLCNPGRQLRRLYSIVSNVVVSRSAALQNKKARYKSTPRVMHVAPILFGEAIGGAERYTLELARAMSRRLPTTLLVFGAQARRKLFGRLEVRVMRNWIDFRRFRFDPLNPLMIRELTSADILHCHQPETMATTIALLLARVSRKPIFSTHLGGAGYGIHRLLDVNRWYEGHLHISEFSLEYFGHRTLTRARVIGGGVDTKRFCPDPWVERTGEILYVGRLLPHKGINYLIEAMDKSVPLTVIGRTFPHELRFFDELKRLAEGKRVSFVLDADDSTIRRAYQRALCVVLPSVHTTMYGAFHPIPELLGQTPLEAMACGTPAICTDVASLPELIDDGITGFMVPPNDVGALAQKISWLRAHRREAYQMGVVARSQVLERFSWDTVVDRCLDAYGVGADIGTRPSNDQIGIAE
jgi:glycosyltransferase involved in cell wall biosynthesis